MPWLSRTLLASLSLAAACGEDDRSLRWVFQLDADPVDVALIEASIAEGSCTDANTPFYFETMEGMERAPAPPVLTPGEYAFRGVAVSPDCVPFARGCQARVLPDDRAEIVVPLLVTAAGARCPAAACMDGACGMIPDGGPMATCDDRVMNGGETGVDCGGPCPPCPCTDSPCTETGLVAHYPFELSLEDATGGGSDGRSLDGTPTYVSGVSAMAIQLDGNGDAVAVDGMVPVMAAFQSETFTIAGWAQHRPKEAAEPRFLWSVDEDGDRDLHYLGFKSSPTLQCRNGNSDAGANIEINRSPPQTMEETWHHFAVTTEGRVWAFYFDGCLVGAAGPEDATPLTGAECFVIGGEQRNACVLGDATAAWRGDVDEVSVFDRVLTAEEIAFAASLEGGVLPVCP